MKKLLKIALHTFVVTSIICLVLTIWANYGGEQKVQFVGSITAPKKALIVYNPDPIYNLDENVCMSFAKGLSLHEFQAKVASIDFAKADTNQYDLYVFCANTYVWAPDWSITSYVKNKNLKHKKVVAITLGAGSTTRAKRVFDETIIEIGAKLIDSKEYWLMRPNNENRMDDDNVEVANSMATTFGYDIGLSLRIN